jgi:hypothetical protein
MFNLSFGNTLKMINKGLLILSLEEIFTFINNQDDKQYELHCEYIEILNDKILDLLSEFN